MSTITTTGESVFATDEIRTAGREKVSGRMKYTADVAKPNALFAAFAISPFAHARILRIDTTAARAVNGVRSVLTAADIGRPRMGRMLYDWPVLASEVVRFPGDRVVAIAAETRAAAERAAALVEVDYEELAAVFDPEEALQPEAPILHPDRTGYFYAAFAGQPHPPVAHPNIQGEEHHRKGAEDLEPLFAAAHRVFEYRFTTPRLHAGHIEPRAALVWVDEDGTVHVISGNKGPFLLRDIMANTIGIPKERIIVEPSGIGGDFGGKGLTIDEIPCYYLAKATGRPVRCAETYTEALRAGPYRAPAHVTLRTAVDADGKFIAHQSTVWFVGGAYAAGKPTVHLLPVNGYYHVPYQIPNVRIDTAAVYTNTAPPAHVRTPVSVQLLFGWEQHVDIMARELGIDPLEFRLLNCVREGDRLVAGEQVRSANSVPVLEALRRESNWGAPVPPGHGRGIAFGCSRAGAGSTSHRLTLDARGELEVLVGVPDQGVGIHTLLQRVAAAALNLELERVLVRRGSTGVAGVDPGVGAAWGTHINGRATEEGASLLRARISERTGATWHGGTFVDDAGRPTATAQLAARACADGPIAVVGTYERPWASPLPSDYMFTALCVEVAVDPETGAYRIVDVVMVVDVGTIINPIGHQGQLDGGFIYGIGNALMEEIELDESGKVTALSLGDYKLPTMADIPPLRTVLVRCAPGEGPFGAKAAGEVSNIIVPAAVANAVANAVGVHFTHFPITSERVFAALGK